MADMGHRSKISTGGIVLAFHGDKVGSKCSLITLTVVAVILINQPLVSYWCRHAGRACRSTVSQT